MINDKPYNDYITESCLDAIKTLDGASYGLKQKDLDRIRALKTQYHLDIPSSITSGQVSTMREADKRDAAGYLAICNTFDMDAAYGDDSDYFFQSMEQFDRSALLTLIHSTGPDKWIQQYKDQQTKQYSLLNAIKTGNRENIVRALISKADGTLVDWPAKEQDKQSLLRSLSAVKLMYDIGNDSFANEQSKTKTYNRWEKDTDLIENISGAIKAISEGDMANNEKYDDDAEIDWEAGPDSAVGSMIEEATSEEPQNREEKPNETSVLATLTKPIKKLFTNSEENQNAA